LCCFGTCIVVSGTREGVCADSVAKLPKIESAARPFPRWRHDNPQLLIKSRIV